MLGKLLLFPKQTWTIQSVWFSIITYWDGHSTGKSFGSCPDLGIQNGWDPQVLFLLNSYKKQIAFSELPRHLRVSHLCITARLSVANCATTSFSVWASLQHDLPQSPFSSSPLRCYWDIFVLRSPIRKLLWPLTAFLFSSRCEWVWYTWHLWTWHVLQYCWELHLHLSSGLHASQRRKQLHGYGLGFLKAVS